MATVDAATLHTFAGRMDELSQRAQNVLQRYEEHSLQVHSSGTLNGAGGSTNLQTAAGVKEAQMRIQTRFQNLNDLVRHNATKFTNTDEQNAQSLAAIPGALRHS